MNPLKHRWVGLIVPVALVVAWQGLWHVPALRMESLSRPSEVVVALWQGLLDGSVLLATRETFESALLGFAIASIIGMLIGITLGLSPRLERIVGPSVDAMRPVPSVALIPLALMLFGFGVRMEALVVAFACVWPVLLVTVSAVRGIDPRLLEVARALEMSVVDRTFKIVLPAALGQIAVALKLSLSIALVVAVTVEIVLNPRGLGYGLMSSQQALRFDQMFALLVWIGFAGWVVSVVSQKLLDRMPGAHVPAMRIVP